MKTNTPHSRLHPNYGKVRLYTLRHYRYVKPFAKQIIQSLRIIILIGVTLLVGYLIHLAYRSDECVELEPVVEVEAEVIIPTPTPEYLPSLKARACIDAKPGVAGKLKEHFGSDWRVLSELVCRESSFNSRAINPTSGAIGLFQRYPSYTLTDECPNLDDVDCQCRNGKRYIEDTYGTVQKAWEFWNKKKAETGSGWY